jgi:putative ABC transport system permease protein
VIGTTLRKRQNRISALDPDVPVSNWEMFDARLTEVTKFARFRAALVGSFALATLLLAVLGVHGVLAQFVALRTSEFGIRIALGAQARDVFWLVTKQRGVSILAGLAAGVPVAFTCGRYLTSLFYEGQSGGMNVLFLGIAALLPAAMVAIWEPAWRASRVEPAVSLRHE